MIMSQGKFSNPRPHRDEERQIEQAFRQITGQEPVTRTPEPMFEEPRIDQNPYQVRQQPVTPPNSPNRPVPPRQEDFDLLPEDLDAFFQDSPPEIPRMPVEEEPDFVDKMLLFFRKAVEYCEKNQKFVMAGACAGALLIIMGFIGMFFLGASDPNEGNILENVYIADICVGGMSKSEAITTVKKATSGTYSAEDMVIDLSGVELRLSPKDTDAQLDVKAAVNAAYDYGRTGTKAEQEKALRDSQTKDHIIGVLPYLDLDTEYIYNELTAYAEDTGSTLTQTSYGLEGREPELSADKFDEDAPTQTLVITMGTPGIGFDVEDVYDQVLDAYSLHTFRVEVENVESVKDPDPIDLEAIYEEFYIEPVNATVNLQNFKTEPGSYGYGFDLKAAQKLVDAAEPGEEIRIPMEYIAPDILDDDSFFRDTLGEYKSRVFGSDDRAKNLALACEAIHETVLNPGESLSFTSALSKSRGFKAAPEDTGLEDTDKGGVSQVASALYYAALLSDVEVSSRANHGYIPSFADPGLDATASLTIRNSTGFPIRIEAESAGGYISVKILGTEERDYYVVLDHTISSSNPPITEYREFAFDNQEGYKDGDVIEEGTTGYTVKTYKIKYDNKTAQKLSEDYITASQYPSRSRIVARVEPEPTTQPTEAPTEPSQETTKPSETTKPTLPPETTAATDPPVQPTEAPTTPSTVPPTEPVIQEAAVTEPSVSE